MMYVAIIDLEFDGAWWRARVSIPKEAHDFGLSAVQRTFSTLAPTEGHLDHATLKELDWVLSTYVSDVRRQLQTITIDEQPPVTIPLFNDEDYVKNGDQRD